MNSLKNETMSFCTAISIYRDNEMMGPMIECSRYMAERVDCSPEKTIYYFKDNSEIHFGLCGVMIKPAPKGDIYA